MKASDVLTVHDVASYLRVNEKTVYRLVQGGVLPGFKVAGTWRFRRQDLDRWIDEQRRHRVTRPGA
jgi:excisionase family DNA binding protein